MLNGTDDFYIVFFANDFSLATSAVTFTTAANKVPFMSTDARVREITNVAGAVPEPASWLMLPPASRRWASRYGGVVPSPATFDPMTGRIPALDGSDTGA